MPESLLRPTLQQGAWLNRPRDCDITRALGAGFSREYCVFASAAAAGAGTDVRDGPSSICGLWTCLFRADGSLVADLKVGVLTMCNKRNTLYLPPVHANAPSIVRVNITIGASVKYLKSSLIYSRK